MNVSYFFDVIYDDFRLFESLKKLSREEKEEKLKEILCLVTLRPEKTESQLSRLQKACMCLRKIQKSHDLGNNRLLS